MLEILSLDYKFVFRVCAAVSMFSVYACVCLEWETCSASDEIIF
jgi:hypothetical protein